MIIKSLKVEVFTQQSRVKATATHALPSYAAPCVTKSESAQTYADIINGFKAWKIVFMKAPDQLN